MRKLDEWIKKLCPDGVAYKKLGGVVSVCRGVRVVRAELQPAGKYPVYQNSLTPMGYHDKGNCIAGTAFIIGAGAAGDIGYSDVPFWAADDCFYFVCEENMNARFLYHVLSGQETFIRGKVRKASVPRLPRNAIENMIVPLPPPDIQHEIVRTLDNFTELTAEITAELTAELTARKQQYEYYRDSLLSFERARIEWRPLSTIADIGTGSSNTNEGLDEGLYPFFVRSQEPRRKNEYEYDETAIITAGDGVGVGKVFHYVEGKYALHQRAYRIHITAPDVLPRYYFHYMRSAFLPYIEKTMYQGSVASIRRPMLNSFPVPIPSMAVQEHIVNVLDNFEDICSDLNIGLPAEIEARKQQYEFYRDLLLTFVETGNTILTDRQTDRQTDIIRLLQYVFGFAYVGLEDISDNCDSQRKPVTKGQRTTGKYPYYGASGIVDYVSDYIYDGDFLLISEDGANLVARVTPIAFSITGKSWVNNHAHVLKFRDIYEQKYVEMYLNGMDLTPYISGAAQPKLNQKNMNAIRIPLPAPEETRRIVDILTQFDKLCSDIANGLPAEISARQQQYEYYRNKLLTFKEK